MKTLFNLSLSLVFLFTQIYSRSAFANQELAEARFQAAFSTEVLNSAKNIGGLLELLGAVATKEETTGIKNYLVRKNIGLDTLIPTAKHSSNKIVFSNGEEFKILGGGRISYKGKQFKKSKALDLMLEEIDQRLSASHSLFNFIIPEAQASWVIVGILAVLLLGFSAYTFMGMKAEKKLEAALGSLTIKCESDIDPKLKPLTFLVNAEEVSYTLEQAHEKGFPPGVYERLYAECLEHKVTKTLSSADVLKIIKANYSESSEKTAKGVHDAVSH